MTLAATLSIAPSIPVAGMALIIRYLAAGRHELDEAAPIDAGRLMGGGR